jgi:hypothetical protein
MPVDIRTLIWLFPIVFMFHDFEEIILGERWLKKNSGDIMGRIKKIAPPFAARQLEAVFEKSAAELAFTVSLIFGLTFISAYLAVAYKAFGFFLLASLTFFLHGFMHVGQAIILRRYVPAVISSVLIVIPYGLVLYWRLFAEGMVNISGLVIYFLAAVALTIPFILVMHKVGDYLYKEAAGLLVGQAGDKRG